MGDCELGGFEVIERVAGLDEVGFPVTDRTGRTTASGVWAAGKAADPRAQIITSAGAGSVAAIAINADLVAEDVERAVEAHVSALPISSMT